MHLQDLNAEKVSTLTRMLQLLPSDDAITYSNRFLSQAHDLPAELKRPNRISRFIHPFQNSLPPLCRLHKPLNAAIANSIFTRIALEVGIRLNPLVSNNHLLTPEHWVCVATLRQLHALWLESALYEKTFGQSASSSKWHYQADRCECCILARISGDLDSLFSLRMALLSRQRTEARRPRKPLELIRWVENWILSLIAQVSNISEHELGVMMAENKDAAQELKKVRKQLWAEKKASKRKSKIRMTSPPEAEDHHHQREQPDEEGPSDYDAEISIIDHYAALVSTSHLPQFPDSQISLVNPAISHPIQILHTTYHQPNVSSVYSVSNDLPRAENAQPRLPLSNYRSPSVEWAKFQHNEADDREQGCRHVLLSPPSWKPGTAFSMASESAWTNASLPQTSSYLSLIHEGRDDDGCDPFPTRPWRQPTAQVASSVYSTPAVDSHYAAEKQDVKGKGRMRETRLSAFGPAGNPFTSDGIPFRPANNDPVQPSSSSHHHHHHRNSTSSVSKIRAAQTSTLVSGSDDTKATSVQTTWDMVCGQAGVGWSWAKAVTARDKKQEN